MQTRNGNRIALKYKMKQR